MNTDLSLVVAIVGSAISIIGVVIAMMFWVRSEGNSLRIDQKDDRKDILGLIRAIESEVKDFHYRLLDIERNRK